MNNETISQITVAVNRRLIELAYDWDMPNTPAVTRGMVRLVVEELGRCASELSAEESGGVSIVLRKPAQPNGNYTWNDVVKVVRRIHADHGVVTQALWDKHRPDGMPTNGAIKLRYSLSWSELIAKALGTTVETEGQATPAATFRPGSGVPVAGIPSANGHANGNGAKGHTNGNGKR